MFEKVIQVNSEAELHDVDTEADRVYIGNDYCEHGLVRHDELRRIMIRLRALRIPFSLLTPVISQRGLTHIRKNLEALAEEQAYAEVVFNDWGVFRLAKRFGLRAVMGRLLTKNKRDPRLGKLSDKLSPSSRAFFADLPVSDALVSFLKDRGIERVELDAFPYAVSRSALRMIDKESGLSFYTGWGMIAHSQECWLNPRRIFGCPMKCIKQPVRLRNPGFSSDVVLLGHTLFSDLGESEVLRDDRLWHELKHVPRVVSSNYLQRKHNQVSWVF